MKILSTDIVARMGGRREPIEAKNIELATESGLIFEITQGSNPNSLQIRVNGMIWDEIEKDTGCYDYSRLIVAPDCTNTIEVHAVRSDWNNHE